VLQNVEDPFERLKAITKAYIDFALENREFYDLMFISRSPMNALSEEDEKWEEGNKAFGALTSTITQCIEKGYFQDGPRGVILYLMVHGTRHLRPGNTGPLFRHQRRKSGRTQL
jgi:hypothetical protein